MQPHFKSTKKQKKGKNRAAAERLLLKEKGKGERGKGKTNKTNKRTNGTNGEKKKKGRTRKKDIQKRKAIEHQKKMINTQKSRNNAFFDLRRDLLVLFENQKHTNFIYSYVLSVVFNDQGGWEVRNPYIDFTDSVSKKKSTFSKGKMREVSLPMPVSVSLSS